MSGSHQSFSTVTLRINATGEYFLLELGAVLRLRMALLFLCWPPQDVIFSAGSGTRHQAKKCAAQRVWEYMLGLCMEKRDFKTASSLTWFDVCWSLHGEMRCRVPLRIHGVVVLLEFKIQVVWYRMENVDLLPDVSICCSWDSRFLCVVRNIDQLSDGKVDLLVLVSTGRTVQCKLLTDVVFEFR